MIYFAIIIIFIIFAITHNFNIFGAPSTYSGNVVYVGNVVMIVKEF